MAFTTESRATRSLMEICQTFFERFDQPVKRSPFVLVERGRRGCCNRVRHERLDLPFDAVGPLLSLPQERIPHPVRPLLIRMKRWYPQRDVVRLFYLCDICAGIVDVLHLCFRHAVT